MVTLGIPQMPEIIQNDELLTVPIEEWHEEREELLRKKAQDKSSFNPLVDSCFLLLDKSLKLEKIMNEKMSKRRIQITDLQKQEIEEKDKELEERNERKGSERQEIRSKMWKQKRNY